MRYLVELAVAAVLFGWMAVAVKEAAKHLPGPEIAFFRFAIGLCTVGLSTLRRPLRIGSGRGLFLRGLFGGAAVYLFFLGIEHLAVGIATLLNYTAPVFTALWALLFLEERLDRSTVLALVLTTLGVSLVIVGQKPAGAPISSWYFVGILSAALSGAAVATIRAIRKTDGSWEIFGAFCIGGALMVLPSTVRHWVAPTAWDWTMLLAVGLLSAIAQVMMTHALGFVAAAPAGVLSQLTPVTALVVGWVLYGEQLAPLAIAGSALTLLAVSSGAWAARRSAHSTSA